MSNVNDPTSDPKLPNWGSDPTFSSFRKVFISHIHSKVKKIENCGVFLLSYFDQPITKVEVVGIVISVDSRAKRITFFVDDGTEIIRCVRFLNSDDNNCILVGKGDLVSAKGTLALAETNQDDYGYFIQLATIESVDDPNYEAFHWMNAIYVHNATIKK